MSQQESKKAIFKSLAEIAHALSHHNRLELLEYLGQGQRSVEELASLSGLTFANTSRPLQILRRARLVKTERDGKYILYSLDGEDEVTDLMSSLGRVGERNNAEVQKIMHDYFHNRGTLQAVSQEELLKQLEAGEVTLLDVRPEHEYSVGHLPGALNIPLEQLKEKLSTLPKEQEIIAYCRGPYCMLSVEALNFLKAQGFKVRRLEQGFPEWKAAGFDIEVSAA